MKFIILLLSLLLLKPDHTQDEYETEKKKILEEGFLLFKLRKAETNSNEKVGKPASYDECVTYFNKDSLVTVFYTKSAGELAYDINETVIHDTTMELRFVLRRMTNRKATQEELELISLKEENKKSTFPMDISPQNIGRYVILYKTEDYYLIYCMKYDLNDNVLPLGGDYCYKKKYSDKYYNLPDLFHKNYIPIDMKSATKDSAIATMHSHIGSTSNYITATDICTLLLYKDRIPFKDHYVISNRHVSKFNIHDRTLIIMKKKDFNKKYGENF